MSKRARCSGIRQLFACNRHKVGVLAELTAMVFLWLKGFQLVRRRFRCPVGEIDLIVRRGDEIAFVEVKYRKDRNRLIDVFSFDQQARVRRAADWFLKDRPDLVAKTCRCDLLFLSPWQWPVHLANAW